MAHEASQTIHKRLICLIQQLAIFFSDFDF